MEQVINSTILIFSKLGYSLLWVLSLPLRIFAALVGWVRAKRYDPEKVVCPSCGFKGNSGTDRRTCTIRFVRVIEAPAAMLRHTCFKCGCDEWYSPLFLPAKKWLAPISPDKVKQAIQRGEL